MPRREGLWSLFVLCAVAGPLSAEGIQQIPSTITVSGEGRAAAPPNMAIIRTGVSSQADTASAALEQNNAAMEEILNLLKERGVAEKDVQTANFNVSPVFEQNEQGRREPKVVGYSVHNEVQVRVRQLKSLGEVLDALVQAGSNQISGVSFDVNDPKDVLTDARRKAMQDARHRAEVYAEAAGVRAGQVLQISEQPVDLPRPMSAGVVGRAAFAAVPIATGEQEFRVTVHVVYALERGGGD